MNKLAYIIILNYKNWLDARECIISILASGYVHYKIILLDNASGDGSIEHLVRWVEDNQLWQQYSMSRDNFFSSFPANELSAGAVQGLRKINFVQNEKNDGFAAGNNAALKYLMHETGYIWLLNPDMLVAPEALGELVQFTSEQKDQVLTGAVLKKYNNPDQVYLYGGGKINWKTATVSFVTNRKNIHQLDYLNGSCIFFKAASLKTLGLLPTDYFLYWEETDWCYRARKTGFLIKVCETAVCYDKISATIGKSYLSDFYYTRNGLLFLKKYSPGNIKFALATTVARIIKRLISGQRERARGMLAGIKEFYKMQRNED